MIRDYHRGDGPQVLALNEASLTELGPMDQAKLARFEEWAPFFRVVEVDEAVVGFHIGVTEQAPHDSLNFAWFAQHYPSFAYIDRVTIAESQRGAGWGPALYREVEAWARSLPRPILCAEVNTEPANPRSLRFHDLYGFDMVDQFEPRGTPDYRVGIMVKNL